VSIQPTNITAKAIALTMLILLCGCVYRVDVQQGNKLEEKDIETVEIGMTRNQIRFILGTPVVQDPFQKDRWDYIYYFRQGRARTGEGRWMIIYFENDKVSKIERDVPVSPS
jgi:outer membrane protein assembly factor BamE